jgi:hypothetical protein
MNTSRRNVAGPSTLPGANSSNVVKVEFVSAANAEEEMKTRIGQATRSITLMINAPVSAKVLEALEKRVCTVMAAKRYCCARAL